MTRPGIYEQMVHGYLLAAGSLCAVVTFLLASSRMDSVSPWLRGVALLFCLALGLVPSVAWAQACDITRSPSN